MKKVVGIIFAVLLMVTALPTGVFASASTDNLLIQDGIMFDHLNYADVDLDLWIQILGPRTRNSGTFHSPGFSANVRIGGANPTVFTRTVSFDLVQQRFSVSSNLIPETRFQSVCISNSQVRRHFDLTGRAWDMIFFRPEPSHNMALDSAGHGNFNVNINNRTGVNTEISGSFSA
jgi:hypothetical protein